ncbi:hypothetical protein G210_2518 [Candida maltosa Xu316]|uniref:Uncharacterized protein n=1 Tax=Candida maltosa (strain Xu316) TaxID=1245528 RepID=M3HIK7_CANMX|nr:hypothetical protein G210_2518 [Candida maltosa Xu316]
MEVVDLHLPNIQDVFKEAVESDNRPDKRRKIEKDPEPNDTIPLYERVFEFHHQLSDAKEVLNLPQCSFQHFKLTYDNGNVVVKYAKRKIKKLFTLKIANVEDTLIDECALLAKSVRDGIKTTRNLILSFEDGVLIGRLEFSIGFICDVDLVCKKDIINKVLKVLYDKINIHDEITPEYFYKTISENTEKHLSDTSPEFDVPELQTQLLNFQKRTVNWILSRENVRYNPETNRVDQLNFMTSENFNEQEALEMINKLWYGWRTIDKNGKKYYFNPFSCTGATFEQLEKYLVEYYNNPDKSLYPLYLNGQGLLAEEMGLGKTVEVTTLMLLNTRPYNEIDRPFDLVISEFGDVKKIVMGKTTLIIAPESILSQWKREIMNLAPSLAITVYRGYDGYKEFKNKPFLIAAYLRKFDVVLTTYYVIARELDFAKFSTKYKKTRSFQKNSHSHYKPSNYSAQDDVDLEDTFDEYQKRREQRAAAANDDPEQSYRALFQLSSVPPRIANKKSFQSQKHTDYEKELRDEIERALKHNSSLANYKSEQYECPLMLIQFWRVVLDEVQMVSSRVSRAFQSASLIPRFHSWGVSGTPIRNDLEDLLSTLKFLRFSPFNGPVGDFGWGKLKQSKEEFSKIWNLLSIRHTKSMVHDDIQLPPQHRILMTVPFTAIEQDLYNREYEQCLESIQLDKDGGPVVDDWHIDKVVVLMRTWLVQLRQLCCSPQVGRIQIDRRKYQKPFTRVAYHGVHTNVMKKLQTLEVLLEDMLNECYSEIVQFERRKLDIIAQFVEFLEFIYYPEVALKFLKVAIIETERLIKRDEILLAKKRQDHKNTSDAIEEIEDDSQADPDMTSRNELYLEDCFTGDANATSFSVNGGGVDDDSHASIQKIQARIRQSFVLLHKFYFLKASCSFQLYDEDYMKVMSQYKIDVQIPQFAMKFLEHNDVYDASELASVVSGLSQKELLFEVDEERQDDSVPHQEIEASYYEKAERVRGQILSGSIANVTKIVESKITSRGFYFEDTFTDTGGNLLPKTSKKFFNALPIMEVSDLDNYVMTPDARVFVSRLKRFLTDLNMQAKVMNEWMVDLVALLTAPVISQDKSPDGNEYDETIKDQEKISAYLSFMIDIVNSRSRNITGSKGSSRSQLDIILNFNIIRNLEEKVGEIEVASGLQFPDFLNDVNSLTTDLETDGVSLVQIQHLKKLADRLGVYFENQKLSLVLFSKELNTSCNAIFNSRVDYYKQLQNISDSVERPEFPSLNREKLVPEMIDSFFMRIQRLAESDKLQSNVARFKYLMGLVNENESDNKDPSSANGDGSGASDAMEDDLKSMCTICRCSITIGTLTHCGHKFCKECLDHWLQQSHKCPLCKAHIHSGSIYTYTRYKPELKVNQVHDVHDMTKLHSIYKALDQKVIEELASIRVNKPLSSKVDMIVKHVKFLKNKNPNVQIVVFSQWQDMLYILGSAFRANSISYVGSHGTLTSDLKPGRRDYAVDNVELFKNDKNITCFLLSSEAQASGLTLTNATEIFLCEPLVNTSLELQAISRIHRIGQKEKTTVWMFAIENTVEESIVITSTEKRLKYLKSNNSNKANEENDSPDELDLTQAESMAMISAEGQKTSAKKSSIQGELVTNHDLWSAFFSARLNKITTTNKE